MKADEPMKAQRGRRKRPNPKAPYESRSEPGPRNRAAIQAAREVHAQRPVRVSGDWYDIDGAPIMGPAHSDGAGWLVQLTSAFGTTSSAFAKEQVASLETVSRRRGIARGQETDSLNAALALIQGVDPQDELEGALAVQMAGCHALAMDMAICAKNADTTEKLALYANLSVKLQRTFTAQIEALAKLRGKGQQTVRVEHVTVHPGGQAIVGDVNYHPPRGGGSAPKSEERPHGTAATAKRSALPSPNEVGDSLPVPGNAERPMPVARRTVSRRKAGE